LKKIIFSFLAIALTIGVVSGTAYALFFDTATVAGISVTAGSADIKISGDSQYRCKYYRYISWLSNE